ncbi:hypothetical protein [Spiroplasma endosymbiont of Amphibalanus improvisus]|uniref:hypothetical protein n=1 Tax=Spiroplasma endosymbiont of Amphibalanus improvisus TaxID=3066327 RepID=UPI00313E435A
MNIPIFEFISEQLYNDIVELNKKFKAVEHSWNVDELIGELDVKQPTNDSFNKVLKFFKNNEKIDPKDRVKLNTVFLYTNSYVFINNSFAKEIEKSQKTKKDIAINTIIVDMFHNKYTEIKKVLEKPEYKDAFAPLLPDVNKILKSNNGQEIGQTEIGIIKELIQKSKDMIQDKKLTPKDDAIIANFVIGQNILLRYLNKLFAWLKEQKNNVAVKENDKRGFLNGSAEDYYKKN